MDIKTTNIIRGELILNPESVTEEELATLNVNIKRNMDITKIELINEKIKITLEQIIKEEK